MKEICPICGSSVIENVDRRLGKYRCKSCDEVFVLAEKPKIEVDQKHVEQPIERKSLTPAEIYKKNIDGIVEITSYFSDLDSRGTAFYVSGDGYLITNLHIVVVKNSCGKIELCKECYSNGKNQGNSIALEIIYLDKNNDLALLKANNEKCKALKLADNVPEIGETVVAIGNVKGTGLSIVNGIIGDTDRDFGGKSTFLFNALVAEGCSGGPIFNDKGEVCGVTVGGRTDTESMKFGIPVKVVRTFLKEAEREKGIRIN